MAQRSDVKSVQPVAIVQQLNETSVPFIGADKVWQNFGAQGQGMVVADVDTGIDYTHANFGGPGTVAGLRGQRPELHRAGHVPDRQGHRRLRPGRAGLRRPRRQPRQRHSAPGRGSARRGRQRPRLAHLGQLLRQRRPRRDRPRRRAEVEAARDQGLGRRRLHRRRSRRRLRARDGSQRRRQHQRCCRRPHLLGRRRLRHAQLRRGPCRPARGRTWAPSSSRLPATPATSRSAARPTSPARPRTLAA